MFKNKRKAVNISMLIIINITLIFVLSPLTSFSGSNISNGNSVIKGIIIDNDVMSNSGGVINKNKNNFSSKPDNTYVVNNVQIASPSKYQLELQKFKIEY
jgi:hypothetical protein